MKRHLFIEISEIFDEDEPIYRIATLGGGGLLIVFALLLFISMLGSFANPNLGFARLGVFFTNSYGAVALLIPAFLAFAAVILASKKYRPDYIFIFCASLLPFLTLAYGYALIRDFDHHAAASTFITMAGKTGIGILILFVSVLEILFIILAKFLLFPSEKMQAAFAEAEKKERSRYLLLMHPLTRFNQTYVEAFQEGASGAGLQQQDFDAGHYRDLEFPEIKPLASSQAFKEFEQRGQPDLEDDFSIEPPFIETEELPNPEQDEPPFIEVPDLIEHDDEAAHTLEPIAQRDSPSVDYSLDYQEDASIAARDPSNDEAPAQADCDPALIEAFYTLHSAVERLSLLTEEPLYKETIENTTVTIGNIPNGEAGSGPPLGSPYTETDVTPPQAQTDNAPKTSADTVPPLPVDPSVDPPISRPPQTDSAAAPPPVNDSVLQAVPVDPIARRLEQVFPLEAEEAEPNRAPPLTAQVPAPKPPVPAFNRNGPYSVPVEGILTKYPDGEYWIIDRETENAALILQATLKEFKIHADVTGIRKGPVITMFEILPAPGVLLSKIVNLQDNIALRLAAASVRIVAPIPGKHAVGIEVPNAKRNIVSFYEIITGALENIERKAAIPVVLGKNISGEAQIVDLSQMPHLLIAGSTGSGKSVCVNSMILSVLYLKSPAECRLILIDPKIVELKLYNDIPHLLTPVITEPKKAFQALQYCICEMERRYACLDSQGVRDIKSYNRRIKERNIAADHMPYIVVVIDEFADLMVTTGKELESTVARLAAMSRAVGIHLVLATQRPSIDVITGLIKANIPSRIAFMVASKMDSRIIIDMVGAEKLLGKGDMLYSGVVDPFPTRIQGAFVSEEEVEKVVECVKDLGQPDYIDDEIFYDEDGDSDSGNSFSDGEDPLYQKALEIVTQQGKASASYIQRRLKIGYNRAARLVEEMEERGVVGPSQGSKPRELLVGL
ncbi:DNA translocase FtsK [Breznakiellaceae bacterium SP9]